MRIKFMFSGLFRCVLWLEDTNSERKGSRSIKYVSTYIPKFKDSHSRGLRILFVRPVVEIQ